MKGIMKFVLLVWIGFVSSLTVFAGSEEKESAYSPEIFENVNAKGGEGNLKLTWSINYEVLDSLKAQGYVLGIQYNTEIRAKREKSGYANSEWTKIKDLPLNTTSYELENLIGGEKYVYKIGIMRNDESVWSEKSKAETEEETKNIII